MTDSFEPSLKDAYDWLRTGRIAPDRQAMAAQQRSQEDYDYRARCMAEAFRGEAGQVALQTILQVTLFRSPVDHTLPTETEYLRHAQLRAGQNQVAATILAYLVHAHTLEGQAHAPAPVPDDTPDLFAGRWGDASPGPGAEPDPGAGADPNAWLAFLDGGPGSAVT